MPWFYLLLAGVFEIVWAVGLKYTHSFTRITPTVGVVVVMGISFYLLTLALKHIPVGTAYAVWTGIGAVGVAIIGMIFLGDPVAFLRILFLVLIVVGIVGLKLFA